MLTTHPCFGGTLSLLFPPTACLGSNTILSQFGCYYFLPEAICSHFIGRPITQDSILNREPCGYTNQPTGVHHGHHNIGYLVGQHKIHEPFGIQILLVSIATLLCLVASILDNPGMHQYIITSLTAHLQTCYPFVPPSDDLSLA